MDDIITRAYDPDMKHWGIFSCTRLAVARQRRSFSKKRLAEAIGKTAPAITQFELDKNRPEMSTVFRIANVLRYPVEYFFQPDLDIVQQEALSFRARSSMTASLREKMSMCGVLAHGILSRELRARFQLPACDLTDLSMEDPEHAAALLRRHWQLGNGPIQNVVHMLEMHGVEVYWVKEDSPCVDAFSFWQDNRPFVILNVHKLAGERGRFDAAHELAHLVLHRNGSDLCSKDTEAQANRFASSFLMPAEQFRFECPKLPAPLAYLALKPRWGVSISAMVRRGRDMGLMSKWQYETACKEISVRRWRTEEPGRLARERSKLHHLVFERLERKGIRPLQFARDIHLPEDELFALMPEAKRYSDRVLGHDADYDLKNLSNL